MSGLAVAGASTRGRVLRAAVVGFAAGFLSGLFGVGGGILIVPGLVLLMGFGQRLAHGTSLAAVLPIAASGLVGFAIEDSVDWPVAAALIAGAIGGAVIGTHWLQVLPVRVLSFSFAAVLLASAVRLLVGDSDAGGRNDLTVGMVLALAAIGVLSGALAGLLGVGGGVVMVPAMVILFAVPGAVARGTSLAVILPTALVASYRNMRNRNADLPVAAAIGAAGVVSAFVASQISVGLDDDVADLLFALLLLVVAVRMVMAGARQRGDAVDAVDAPE